MMFSKGVFLNLILFLLFRQLQVHIPEHTPHQISLSIQRSSFNRFQMSKVIYKDGCWDCNEFYVGKTNQVSVTEKLNMSRPLLEVTIH